MPTLPVEPSTVNDFTPITASLHVRMSAKIAATGAAAKNPSSRSNNPPWPGMVRPESFTPSLRLIALSSKSPALCEKTEQKRRRQSREHRCRARRPPAARRPEPPISSPPMAAAPGLARGDLRRELRRRPHPADQIGADIRAPDDEDQKHRVAQPVIRLQPQPEQRDAAEPGIGNARGREPAGAPDRPHSVITSTASSPGSQPTTHLAHPDRQQQAGQQRGSASDPAQACSIQRPGRAAQRPPDSSQASPPCQTQNSAIGPRISAEAEPDPEIRPARRSAVLAPRQTGRAPKRRSRVANSCDRPGKILRRRNPATAPR